MMLGWSSSDVEALIQVTTVVIKAKRMLSIRSWSVEVSTDLPRARRPSLIVFTRNFLLSWEVEDVESGAED